MSERAVDNQLPIRRHTHVTQHLDRELLWDEPLREAHRIVQRLLDLRHEWHLLALAARHVDVPDLPFTPDEDGLAVRSPCELRAYRP